MMLSVAACAFAAAESAGPDVSKIVAGLQERYDSTADFTATFIQEIEVRALGRTLESRGTVAFKRPGRMRWEFLEPERQTIVTDGEVMWIYQAEQHQVLKTPFWAAFQSSTPISFLFGVGDLNEDFEPSLLEADAEIWRLRLEPREGDDIGTLVVTVDRVTHDLHRVEVTDLLGNVTRLRFEDFRRDEGVPDDYFVFEIPEGADVVEAPGRNPTAASAGE